MVSAARPRGRDLALSFALAVLGRSSAWRRPLNRDLAQYLYAGAEVRRGAVPYRDVSLNKGPLTFWLFAGVGRVAGTRSTRVRLALLPATLASVALVRATVDRLAPGRGAAAAAAFAALSPAAPFDADEPNTEVLGSLPALAAAWGAARGDVAGAGLAGTGLALALLVNPSFAFAGPPLALGLGADARRGAAAGLGLALPLLAAAAHLHRQGALEDFRRQVLYPLTHAAESGWRQNTIDRRATNRAFLADVPAPALWAAGLAGCAAAAGERATRRAGLGASLWALGVWTRIKGVGYAFPHHYVPALPALAAGLALGADAVARRTGLSPGAVVAAAAAPFVTKTVVAPELRDLRRRPWDRSRARPGDGLAYPASAYLREHSAPGDRIFVPGSEPAVLWLAGRRAPSRFFDVYALPHDDGYMAERGAGLLADPPPFICTMPASPTDDPHFAALVARHPYAEVWSFGGSTVLRREDPA